MESFFSLFLKKSLFKFSFFSPTPLILYEKRLPSSGRNGQCILKDRVCNQRLDCFDGTDELNCTYNRLKSDKSSLEIGLVDVHHSSTNPPTPSKVHSTNQTPDRVIEVREGFTAILRCMLDDQGPPTRLPVSWFRLYANNLIKLSESTNVVLRGGRLILNRVSMSDAGVYLCRTSVRSITTILSVQGKGKELNDSSCVFF